MSSTWSSSSRRALPTKRSATAFIAAVADVDAELAAVAGFFTARALEPPPPGLPTLRPFQAAQAEVARAWLAERLHFG